MRPPAQVHRLSLRRRLAVIAALAVAAGIALASAAAFLTSQATLVGQLDSSLESQAHVLASGPMVDLNQPQTQLFALVPALQLVTADGQRSIPDYQRVVLPVDGADLAVARGQRAQVLRTVTVAGRELRMITVPYLGPGGTGVALQLTRPLADVNASLHRLAVILTLVTAGGVVVAVTAGLAVASTGLGPVTGLARSVEHVARTGDLDARLSVVGDDEIARLAGSFNALLAALALSRDRQRRLVADASHELRTPLTSLRTNIELLARARGRDRELAPEDHERLLADLTGQTEELAALVGELTALARDELPEEDPVEIDLAEVVGRALTRVRRRAGDIRIVAELEPTPMPGRPAMLERAVLNLLDNAVKWSPPDGEVYVGLRTRALVVADQGPGVAEEDLPHVFERFYRSTAARGMPGSGLGLAIVAAAARQHRAAASLERGRCGGTVARLVFPAPAGWSGAAAPGPGSPGNGPVGVAPEGSGPVGAAPAEDGPAEDGPAEDGPAGGGPAGGQPGVLDPVSGER